MDTQWELALLYDTDTVTVPHQQPPLPTLHLLSSTTVHAVYTIPEYDYFSHGLSVILFAFEGMFSFE
jgi:hypothetical protein